MPANGRWDLIRHLKVNHAGTQISHGMVLHAAFQFRPNTTHLEILPCTSDIVILLCRV